MKRLFTILASIVICQQSMASICNDTIDLDFLSNKKIGVIGDSYVRNHKEPIENTWHYKFAQKHQMEYYNYGRNSTWSGGELVCIRDIRICATILTS